MERLQKINKIKKNRCWDHTDPCTLRPEVRRDELNSIRNGYQKDVKAIEKAVEAEKATKAELERLQQELVQSENTVKILQTQLERNNNELIIIK